MANPNSDEQVLWEGTRAWADFGRHWLGAALSFFAAVAVLFYAEGKARYAALPLFLAALAFTLAIWVGRLSRRYRVTSRRATTRLGLISRRIYEIELKDIVATEVSQTFWQRLSGTGTVWLSTPGRSRAAVFFRGISDPEGVNETIRQQRKGSH